MFWFRYLIIEAHVHPTVQHHVLTSQGHQYAATTNIYVCMCQRYKYG